MEQYVVNNKSGTYHLAKRTEDGLLVPACKIRRDVQIYKEIQVTELEKYRKCRKCWPRSERRRRVYHV